MANENSNGTFRRCTWGIVASLLVLWLSWASASINTLNTKQAVTDTQYAHIQQSLTRLESMMTKYIEEGRK
jgi:hypothetical protein